MTLFTSSVWNESGYPWDRTRVVALADASDALTNLLRTETGSDRALVVMQPNFSGYNVEVWSDSNYDIIAAFLAKHKQVEIERAAAKLAEVDKPVANAGNR